MPEQWETWKDGELEYLRSLVRFEGDANVPKAAVESYLRIQAASAKRSGLHDLAARLHDCADAVSRGEFDWAACLIGAEVLS